MLNKDQIEFYQDNGYLLVKELFSKDEARKYRTHLHDLFDRIGKQIDATWGSAEVKGETQLQHCHDVQFYDATYTNLICDPRLTDATSELIGSPNVQLHHTKAFIKPPEKGSPFPLHQDAPFFPHERHSMIAAIVHFDDSNEKKGCVRVIPGTHKNGILPHISQGNFHLDKEAYPISTATSMPAEAGDVLFISYLVIHGSGVNESDEERTTLLVQMRDPEDQPTVDTHNSRGQGMMLRGINPTAGKAKKGSARGNGNAMLGGSMQNSNNIAS